MGAHHEITQPFARKDLQVPLPDYHRWEGESIPGETPEQSVTGMAAMLLFVSMLAIGTFATLLIVW